MCRPNTPSFHILHLFYSSNLTTNESYSYQYVVHSTSVVKAKKIHVLSMSIVKGKVKNNICGKKRPPGLSKYRGPEGFLKLELQSQEMTALNKVELIPQRQ